MTVRESPDRPVAVTLVVAGAPRSGKSALLRTIQSRMSPARQAAVPPLLGESPLLDWLPIDLGQVGGRDVHLNLYVVPPPTGADTTRRMILAEADGILFVADSQAHRIEENVSAMADLWGGLGDVSEHPRRIPMVILYSKQDLPPELILPREALDDLVNIASAPSFAGDALRGTGVLEALQAVLGPTLRGLAGGHDAPAMD